MLRLATLAMAGAEMPSSDGRTDDILLIPTGLSTRGDTHTRMGVGCRILTGGWVDFLPTRPTGGDG